MQPAAAKRRNLPVRGVPAALPSSGLSKDYGGGIAAAVPGPDLLGPGRHRGDLCPLGPGAASRLPVPAMGCGGFAASFPPHYRGAGELASPISGMWRHCGIVPPPHYRELGGTHGMGRGSGGSPCPGGWVARPYQSFSPYRSWFATRSPASDAEPLCACVAFPPCVRAPHATCAPQQRARGGGGGADKAARARARVGRRAVSGPDTER